ncbi:MAG TPA: hypothetical protein VM100_12115, partial [Longimicrobiales bacterium]|nr:hypothetical protein [Longimicrobiales bacterium]
MVSNAKLGRVLAIYASASFAVLQVVDLFQDRLDLPDWVFPAAVVLLIVGLPIVVLTAIVQVQDFSPFIERHFTWKRSLMGGALAFLVLGLSAAAYVGSRKLGIGPGASLVSSGVLSDADRIVIAQFDGPATDSALTTMFTEAVRMSLGNSGKIKPLPPAEISDVLALMKLPKTTPLKHDVAKDVALRVGAKAIVNGTLAHVGNSFITTLTLQSPANGETLFSSSVTAEDASKLIASIDKLARRLRKKIGDSLKDLRDEPALAKATTSSLEALKKYSLGVHAASINGDLDRAVRLYEEAIALDSTFALAYVRLGSSRINRGDPPARTKDVITTAYRLRDRLSPRERRIVEAYYEFQVRGDHSKAVDLYTAMLDDGDSSILNNLGHQLALLGRHREAEKYLRLAVADDAKSYYPFSNLADVELHLGNVDAADSVAEQLKKALPGHPRYYRIKSSVALARESYDDARTLLQHLVDSPLPSIHAEGIERMSYYELMRGRTNRARALMDDLVKTRQA